MDRRSLLAFACTALMAWGCSKDKSLPPTAVAPAAKVSDGASSSAESESVAAVPPASAPREAAPEEHPAGTPGAATPTDTVADEQRELERERARAEQIRRQVLEEIDRKSGFGAFGSARQGEGQASVAPADAPSQNPLRTDLLPTAPPPAAAPVVGNPLRQVTQEPRIPSTPPLGVIAPTSPAPFTSTDTSVPRAPQSSTTAETFLAEPAGGAASPAVVSSPKLEPRPVPSSDENEFDVVEILYGTDRESAEQKASQWHDLLLQFVSTVTVGLFAVGLLVVAAGRKSWLLGAGALFGFGGSFLLGYNATDEVIDRIRGANKQGPRYTTDRAPGGHIELGRCEVSVPRSHTVSELEAPSILRFEISESLSQHLILQKTERLESSRFHNLLRQRVGNSARRELFVFVHGFNVSFEDAARRTAQIHYDLKFDGAPIFFSWPANDKFIFTYAADETNVAWAVPHLKKFLLEIVKESQAQSINLIAHSMGNRALAAALREIDLEFRDQSRLFNQVILAAPDIDADDFRNNIAPALQRTARGLTLYASSHDEALLASQFIHRRPRAGDAGDGLTVIAGIDTIDVTAIDQSLWGHSYYGSSHPVLQDLKALLSRAVPPGERIWLSPAQRDGLTYWIFQPTRTAAREAAQAR